MAFTGAKSMGELFFKPNLARVIHRAELRRQLRHLLPVASLTQKLCEPSRLASEKKSRRALLPQTLLALRLMLVRRVRGLPGCLHTGIDGTHVADPH
jgi:hypothetical protein